MSSLDAGGAWDLAPLRLATATEVGPWARKWLEPPPDIPIGMSPQDGRSEAAHEIGLHVIGELARGRSLYCIVHDRCVQARIGGFDGRALPAHCLERVEACAHRRGEVPGAPEGAGG